jgi:hypothetical protein
MAMAMRVDLSGALVLCVVLPKARIVEETGAARIDRETGKPIFRVKICLIHGDNAETLWVSVPGEPAGLVLGQPLKLTGLRGQAWEQGNRSGTAYRADAITPLNTSASDAGASVKTSNDAGASNKPMSGPAKAAS